MTKTDKKRYYAEVKCSFKTNLNPRGGFMGKINCLALFIVSIFVFAIFGQEQKDSLVFQDKGNKMIVLHVTKVEEIETDDAIPFPIKIATYQAGGQIFQDTVLRLHWFLGYKIIREIKEKKATDGYDMKGKIIQAEQLRCWEEEKINKIFFFSIFCLPAIACVFSYLGYREGVKKDESLFLYLELLIFVIASILVGMISFIIDNIPNAQGRIISFSLLSLIVFSFILNTAGFYLTRYLARRFCKKNNK